VILIGGFFVGFAWFYLKVVESSTGLKWWVQYLTEGDVDLLFGGFVMASLTGFFTRCCPASSSIPRKHEASALLAFSIGIPITR